MAYTVTTTDEQVASFASLTLVVVVIILLMSPTLHTLFIVVSFVVGMNIASIISTSKCYTKTGEPVKVQITGPGALQHATPQSTSTVEATAPTNAPAIKYPANKGYVTDQPNIDEYDAQPDIEPISGNSVYVPDVYEGAVLDGDDDIGINSLSRNCPKAGVSVINDKMSAYLTEEVEDSSAKEWWGAGEY